MHLTADMKKPVKLLLITTLFFPIIQNGSLSGTISYYGSQPNRVSCDKITVNLLKNIPRSEFFTSIRLVASVNATTVSDSPRLVCKYVFDTTTIGDYILEAQDAEGFRVESKSVSINPSSITTKDLKLFPPLK